MDLPFDRRHVWHPDTSTRDPLTCSPVIGAEGVMIRLEDGHPLIDGMSSWWAAIHADNHPHLKAAALAAAWPGSGSRSDDPEWRLSDRERGLSISE